MVDSDEVPGPDETTVRWFGTAEFARLDERTHVPTPVGEMCVHCREPIQQGDDGITIPHLGTPVTRPPYHYACFMESVLNVHRQ